MILLKGESKEKSFAGNGKDNIHCWYRWWDPEKSLMMGYWRKERGVMMSCMRGALQQEIRAGIPQDGEEQRLKC